VADAALGRRFTAGRLEQGMLEEAGGFDVGLARG
jgi:hypothetical protein